MTYNCDFQENENERWECSVCHYVHRRQSPKPPRRNCSATTMWDIIDQIDALLELPETDLTNRKIDALVQVLCGPVRLPCEERRKLREAQRAAG